MFKLLLLLIVLFGLGALIHYVQRNVENMTALEDEENTDEGMQERELEMVPLMPLEEIFAIRDPSDFVMALSRYLCEKCDYDANMEALSEQERVFYITMCLEAEVNNGGFSQFFCHSSGDFGNEVVGAFTEIGAVAAAEICRKAVSIFGERVPPDREQREQLLMEHTEVDRLLTACDAEFYQCTEDLFLLRHSYVIAHRSNFT